MKEPFEQTVQRHGATVLRVCRAVLGPGADSEDAWSETFLAALRAWPDLDKNTNVQAWLVRVAQRKAIDITRTRARYAIPPMRSRSAPHRSVTSRTNTSGCGRRWPHSRSGNVRPWPTTISVGSPTWRPPN